MGQKITDLLKQKFGISKISKSINLNYDDDLFTAYKKTAKFLYKNAKANDEISKDDEIQAIKNKTKNRYQEITKIEAIDESQLSEAEVAALEYNCKFKTEGQDSWKSHLYKAEIATNLGWQDEGNDPTKISKRQSLIILDPQNSTLKNHDSLLKWRQKSAKTQNWLSKDGWHIYNSDLLIGYDKLITDLRKDSPYRDKPEKAKVLNTSLFYLQEKHNNHQGMLKEDGLVNLLYKEGKPSKDNYYYEYTNRDGEKLIKPRKMVEKIYERNVVNHYLGDYLKSTYNLTLQQEYEQNKAGVTHAKFYQEKKNIKKETQAQMDHLSSLLGTKFKDVEIDNAVDLEKLTKLEPELKETSELLPQGDIKPSLRFRKLRNYNALGMFTPINNTVAVDFRSNEKSQVGLQSFVHEYGHYIDFNLGQKLPKEYQSESTLSLSEAFKPTLEAVQKQVSRKAKTAKDLKYYSTPTEVFARSFEAYVSSCGLDNSLIKDKEVYQTPKSNNFNYFNDNTTFKLNNYFDHAFPTLREKVVEQVKQTTPKNETKQAKTRLVSWEQDFDDQLNLH